MSAVNVVDRSSENREIWSRLRRHAAMHLGQGRGDADDAVILARLVRRTFGDPRLFDWQTIGIAVRRRRLAGSGLLLPDRFPIEVWVRAGDDPRRQRFTVAHEICHLLLRDTSSTCEWPDVEQFCDTFASELLVPRSRLSALRTATGALPSAEEIVQASNWFRVNLTPVLLQLQSLRVRQPSFALLAEPEESGVLRIKETAGAGAIGGPVCEQHLATVGSWGTEFEGNEFRFSGIGRVASRFLLPTLPAAFRDESIRKPLARSGYVSGTVSWTGFKLKNGRVVISATFLHLDELKLSKRRNEERVLPA